MLQQNPVQIHECIREGETVREKDTRVWQWNLTPDNRQKRSLKM